ncbi:bifunctional pyr operon transcriptional regulator/uracil phosphoribosyltransferase PyrR [Catalinimonas niigatensis]|uniref:bifunctional pyr operon transcriptional regulator/uracil phosphoribosyltransferase PyrR n=1 Tax=Catalinimonas niigatensis TaxID=1397264 RepID=UPI002666C06B|nr:bifunctional pyr operon transcriptional regulator/uracil phosphoribosyltransferase PyrR [Catalinimonas niigatensis]WPP49300.1 bifunctional pyr operon transcriptional regulator/uracil phosphoribosyltransferase PyrR [Catalinimonas niigatensis]
MKQIKQIIDQPLLEVVLSRLCHQLLENHTPFDNTVLLGLQPRGVHLADRIKTQLEKITGKKVPLGYLDTTFYRDDFRRRSTPIAANTTNVPFLIEDKDIILIDDVLYTGRTVRAAMDAMITFGRPSKVELLVLINRKYARHLPIEANYIGQSVNTLDTQRVEVLWKEQGEEDGVWLANKQEDKA